MLDDARDYLLDRFRTDARTLRRRADDLAAAPAPPHGPGAAASAAMADACDEVIARLETLDPSAPLEQLAALGPVLRARADGTHDGFVRSVYAGAAQRIDEVVARARRDATTGRDA